MTKRCCDFAGCFREPREASDERKMLVKADDHHFVSVRLTGYDDLCDEHFILTAIDVLQKELPNVTK